MITFLMPIITVPPDPRRPSWMARIWRWRHAVTPPFLVQELRTGELLRLIDRVRGAEATLARLKAERP